MHAIGNLIQIEPRPVLLHDRIVHRTTFAFQAFGLGEQAITQQRGQFGVAPVVQIQAIGGVFLTVLEPFF